MERQRFAFVWTGLDAPRTEYVDVKLSDDGLVATGVQIGVEPEPYSVRYELRTDARIIARRLVASSRTMSWQRDLTLHRGPEHWQISREALGIGPDEEEMAHPEKMPEALDVDLGFSPLFNSTPVLRDRLHEESGAAHDYLMAWVSVPDLRVTASRQRYEPLGVDGDLAVVRYTSLDSGFTAKIRFDQDGFVVEYEDFLRRIAAERGGGS